MDSTSVSGRVAHVAWQAAAQNTNWQNFKETLLLLAAFVGVGMAAYLVAAIWLVRKRRRFGLRTGSAVFTVRYATASGAEEMMRTRADTAEDATRKASAFLQSQRGPLVTVLDAVVRGDGS